MLILELGVLERRGSVEEGFYHLFGNNRLLGRRRSRFFSAFFYLRSGWQQYEPHTQKS